MIPRYLLIPALLFVLLPGLSSALTQVTSCSDLSVAGETYSLQNDVSGSMPDGNCLHISASSVTLECNGHGISSNDSIADIIGIRVDGTNATVRDCHVTGYTNDGGTAWGLLAYGQGNLTVQDCSFGKNEIGLEAYSANAIIVRSNATGNSETGFIIENSPHAAITDNLARDNDAGFSISASDYSVIERNLADSSATYNGFDFISCSFMRISGNTATGNYADGFHMEAQQPESFSNFTDNLAYGNGFDGFHLYEEDNNLLLRNNATDNGANGFYVESGASVLGNSGDRNTFVNNLATGNGYGVRCLPGTYPCPTNGFLLDMANYTNMSNNRADGNAGYGFVVYRGEYNVLDSNNASGNDDGGFLVSAHEDIRRSHNNLTNNLAFENGMFGFYLRDDNNFLARNNATGNGASGFYLNQPICRSWVCSGDGNTLLNNTAAQNGYGAEIYCPDDGIPCLDGYSLSGVDNTILGGNTADGNYGNGFGIYLGSYNSLTANNATGNGLNGFLLDDSGAIIASSYNNLSGNMAEYNSDNGFAVYDDNNRLEGNRAGHNSGNGFHLSPPTGCSGCSADDNELIGNTAYDNGEEEGGTSGFFINAPHTALTNNTAYGNFIYGFRVDSSIFSHVEDIQLSGNRAYGHRYCDKDCTGAGFRFSGTTVAVYSPFQASMADNLAYDNDYGLVMFNGDLAMSEDRFYGNTIDLDASNPSDRVTSTLNMSRVVFDGDSGSVSDYTTLSLNDSLYYDSQAEGGEHYSIDHAAAPAGDSPYGIPFWNKFVNITDYCLGRGCLAAEIDSIAWHWTLREANDFSNISLWEYDGEWTFRNNSAIDNSLSLSRLNGFSVFGLYGNFTPDDNEDDGQPPGDDGTPPQNQTQPECVTSSDCAVNEVCAGSSCVRFPCACGAVQNHQCVQYECCTDAQCGGGASCDTLAHACRQQVPQYECTTNLQCAANDYCKIPSGAAGGTCEPVESLPCGEVANHSFTAYGYECGSEPGCPSCPTGAACEAHKCIAYLVTCPTTGIVGDEKTCSATRDGLPCPLCSYSVASPDGNKTSGKTDEDGNFRLPLKIEGTYLVSLLSNGQAVKAIDVKAFPAGKPNEPEKPQAGPDFGLFLWLVLILLLVAGVLVYWRRRGNKLGQKK
jgi:parallel beta-helix repeat protein